ncbi:MAG TPA: hypothetical protein VFO19_04355, partial [Vicinamibacterales bacterium]|nr:hypothetical protein [Vicinamibacterales bacterium]
VAGSATGRIEPGTRGAAVEVAAPAESGPWRAAIRVEAASSVLQETVDVQPADGDALGPLMLFRATPSPRSPIVATVDPLFRRTERAHAEWTVAAGVTAGDVQVRLLDRNGTALAVPVTVGDRRDSIPRMTADVNLAPLTEGDYVLELTVRAAGNERRRLVPIRVTR